MPQTARAVTYTVCPPPPPPSEPLCDFPSPDVAVNDPDILDGDIFNIFTNTYTLTATLQVDKTIEIQGNGSVFDASGMQAIDVTGAATNFSLSDVTIRNGLADAESGGGGALRVSGGATVTITLGIFENNQAEFGGAVHNIGSTVDIIDSVFIGNQATAGEGGAILTESGGVTDLTQTTIDGNQASLNGGGLAVADADSELNLIGSTVSNNAIIGIGISGVSNDAAAPSVDPSWNCPVNTPGISAQSFVVPTLTSLSAYDFEIRLGASPPAVGSILVGKVLDIQNGLPGVEIGTSTLIVPASAVAFSTTWLRYEMDIPVVLKPDNLYLLEVEVPEGPDFGIMGILSNPYAAGEASNCGSPLSPDLDFDFRTFAAVGGSGGIFASQAGLADLFNTTVSGNVGDGAKVGFGGQVTTLFSTISNNSGNGLTNQTGDADGLVFITASIIAGNGGADCSGNITSSGFNLIGDSDFCNVTPSDGAADADANGVADGDQIDGFIDPLLGPLQDNGGPTATHAIDASSLAFNAAGADGALPCSDAATDQRGVARPNAGACDIGAFEFESPVGPLQTLINAADADAVINLDGPYNESIILGDGITLRGTGPATTVIDVTGLDVSAITATGDFTLEGIRVTGGNAAENGGGIVANVAGTDITLLNVVFDNNDADMNGGAIYLSDGTLTATNVTFTNNSAGRNGGAITALFSNMAVFNGTFNTNTAGDLPSAIAGNGGAIILSGGTGAISASFFTGNQAFSGDGVAGRGGAIFNDGNLSIMDTTIDTSVAGIGGGIYNNPFSEVGGSLDIAGSTLSDNTADNPAATAGGAIGGGGVIEIRNATLSGNTAVSGNGGGIGLTGGTANLNNVTLAFNTAPLGQRGALFAEPGALISLSNSLLSGNSESDDPDPGCGTVNSLGYNLSAAAGCLTAATDITAPPLINSLADNGGLTKTHSLQALSPAIDAGHPVPSFTQFDTGNFSQLQTQGDARLDGNTLLLAANGGEVGSAFVAEPIDPSRDFSAKFEFLIVPDVSGDAADGFTFTISDDPTVLGGSGGFLGIADLFDDIDLGQVVRGVVKGVSVEFDTWVNGEAEGANDPGAVDHIGIDINGSLSSVAIADLGAHGILSDDNVWTAWIDYDAGGETPTLEVRASNDGVRPNLPKVSAGVDIASLTGPIAYVGFTGATGTDVNSGEQRILSFSLDTYCEATDQRGVPRPKDAGCDIGAYEAQIALELGDVTLRTATVGEELLDGMSYPGVVEVEIIDIPIEKLTGDSFNAPSSAPLGSFPLGSFPIGSFDLQSSPLGSFPLGSFPIGSFPLGSFPLGSFPLSSIPLDSAGGWAEILESIPKLAGAPLQTVTLEQVLRVEPLPDAVASIALRDLSIEGSPLASLSLPGLSLGATSVADLDAWAVEAGEGGSSVCDSLDAADPLIPEDRTWTCDNEDTLMGLEMKGAPVSALSLASLPLGSFPIGSFPLGSFPIGSFPLGSFPLGSFPLGSFPLGSFPLSSFPLGSFPLGSFPLGSFNMLAAPLGSFPLGSFPLGSFPLGSFEIDGKPFCQFYDEVALADSASPLSTCADLSINPDTNSLADLVEALQAEAVSNGDTSSGIGSTPLGSFPLGSFDIANIPLGSFSLDALSQPPMSELSLGQVDVEGMNGCDLIAANSTDSCSTLLDSEGSALDDNSTLEDVAFAYGTLATSPLGSFPIGSFGVAGLPMGSFPLGSFEINGIPLGSFPLGSFDLLGSPLGSFPLGSFGSCEGCTTLADAVLAGVLDSTATLAELKAAAPTDFAALKLGDVLDAMTLAMLYGPGVNTLGQIENTGNLTLGQLLISMMLKTDFPWETIPLARLGAQEFSADNFVTYSVAIQLQGTEAETFTVEVTLDDSFLYLEDSSALFVIVDGPDDLSFIDDPVITTDNEDGTQTLSYSLNLGGFNTSVIGFSAVPSIALGTYAATATVQFGSNDPVTADNSNAAVTVIPDPLTDPSGSFVPLAAPGVLYLGFIDTPDDNDFFEVQGVEGSRVAVFMSNPAGDNDLIMYEPVSTVETKGQTAQSPALDSIPFEDDGIDYQGNLTEEPNALEDVNLAAAPLASISTNRGDADESVSAIAGDDSSFLIQVSGYNGATSRQPYTLRVKVTPQVPTPQCTARSWLGGAISTVVPAGDWMPDTNAVFLVNGARLAASDPGGAAAADDALTAINNLVNAPGITNGVVVDVSTIFGADYTDWDANPCDVDAANTIVNAITAYLEVQRELSPDLAYVTIVGSDEVIPFARKPDETSIANESTFAGEFSDNAMFGALVTRHFLSDDTYGDIDPIPWLDRFLNVPELGVGRLLESAADIQAAAENYIAFGGVLDPQTALSAGYDFIADAAQDIDDTFNTFSPALGFSVEPALIDQPDVDPLSAWTRSDFLSATGLNSPHPTELVSFNMHFDFDEALPSSGDAAGNYTDNLINTADLGSTDLAGGIWFTVGCHSGTSVADVSVVGGAPSDDWAQAFSRLGATYLAQNAYGLGDTEAVALTERLMANFARNLNGSLTIGQAHALAKQQYFADLGLYGEYDYKALQAATLFGLPMYQYGNGAMVAVPPSPILPVTSDPLSGLMSASWSLSNTGISETSTSKGSLFNVDGEVQFVHFRPLQPIVRRDVTGPGGEIASGAFLTALTTEDIAVDDIAFARPVIDLGDIEPEIETDEVVFPTAFTNIANFKAPPPGGGPFAPRQQLNVIVGQFTSPLDGATNGTERLFRSFDAQVFYRPAPAGVDDFLRPEFDNVQASVVGPPGGAQQAAFSLDVFDEGTVLRVAVLYLQSVTGGEGNWVLVDLLQGSGSNTWTGGGPVDDTALAEGRIDYMVQAVDDSGNVGNSTFKGLFYVAKKLEPAPQPGGGSGSIGVLVTVDDVEVNPDDWISADPVKVQITDQGPGISYEFSVDFAPFVPLTPAGFEITEDGVHIVTVQESDGENPVTFVVLIDTTPPQVVITTPAAGEFVVQTQEPAADFDCLDAGSGITTCVGTVPDSAPVPSAATGNQSFVVTAQDGAELGPAVAENIYYVVQPLVVSGPVDPTATGNPVEIIASTTDLPDFVETATINWGDGTIEMVDLSVSGISVNNMSGSHSYSTPDVYQITVTVDYEGKFTHIGVLDFVVVYDPAGGFVTGGGWFDSPPDAYTPNDRSDTNVTGKAHFGFVSKYKKGKTVPGGSTHFRFAAGDLEFDATAYDWMVISGARARYKGEGTVNGGAELYQFQVTTLDADENDNDSFTEDSFRIKIWLNSAGGDGVLYDNGLGADDSAGSGGTTPLGGGSITVHQAKKK